MSHSHGDLTSTEGAPARGLAGSSVHLADRLLEIAGGTGQRVLELVDPVAEVLELGLEREDLAHPDEADAFVGELLDPLEQRRCRGRSSAGSGRTCGSAR